MHGDHIIGAQHDLDREHHLALRGELDGIAAQVQQHLLQAHRVAHQLARQQGVNVKQHFDRLLADVGGQDHGQVAQHLVHGKGVWVQRHFAGLDFGEIQNFVEQPQ